MAKGRVIASPEFIAEHLCAYGEDVVARQIQGLSSDQLERIAEISFEQACSGLLLAKSLAIAAVYVIEGKPRPLKRNKRMMRAYRG